MLGAEPSPPQTRPVRMPGDPSGDRFERKLVDDALSMQNEGLERDRNLLDVCRAVWGEVRPASSRIHCDWKAEGQAV